MRNLTLVLALTLASLSFNLSAQSTVSNVLNLRSAKQSGEIIENNKLVGYYVFFFKEKADKKNSAYEIEVFDDNYNSVKKFEIVRPKNTYMLEMVFNGDAFMLHFFDQKIGYEFVTYDRSGAKKGSVTIPKKEIPMMELQRSLGSVESDIENVTIYPTENGFVRQTFSKNKKLAYEVVAYDNDMKELWSCESPASSKLVETIEINDVTEQIVAATVSKKKNIMTREVDLFALLIDTKSGKVLTEKPLGNDEEGKRSVTKAFIDEANSKIIMIGEFYKPGDDFMKDKSLGLYLQELTMSGDEISMDQYKWKGEIDRFKQENIDEEDRKEADKPFWLFFHDAIRAENGNLVLIGEQFKKKISAAGIGGVALVAAVGGEASLALIDILVGNMVVIEFDKTNKMVGYDLVKKKKTTVALEMGTGLYSPATLGYMVKMYGGFDYAFTSRDAAADKYNVVYIDANRKEEKESKKSDVMIGLINIDGGKVTSERIPVNTTAKFWWLQPAKPGYIAVGEYFRKEKEIRFRLEQLTY
jgi:hypothetical protein